MTLRRRIYLFDGFFFKVKDRNSDRNCSRAIVNNNCNELLEEVEKLEDLVAYNVPSYSDDLHNKGKK